MKTKGLAVCAAAAVVAVGGWVPVVRAVSPPRASAEVDVRRELPELRTEFSTTYANPDGTRTTLVSSRPVHFATAAGWAPIDTTLVADVTGGGASGSGVVRTVANSWTAAFAPEGVRVRDGDDELALLPVGGAARAPRVGLDGSSVTYDDVWPGVDLRYRVLADELKEEIVLTRRPDTNVFTFATSTAFEADPDAPGGLRPVGPLAAAWRVPPPEVLDAAGMPVDGTVARFAATAGAHIEVTVDDAWLAGLAPSGYPVVVDPTYTRGLQRSYSFRHSGGACGSPCPIRMGNPDPSWRTWRAAVYFPYEPLFGKRVTHAQVEVWGLSAGAVSNFPSDLYHSTANNWHSVHELLVDNAQGGGNYVYTSAALTSFYDSLVAQRRGGASLKFVGDEGSPGYSSYKQFDSFQLRLDWTERPPALTGNPAAAPDPVFEDDHVTISQPWSHPTERARVFVCKGQGATPGGCTAGTWGVGDWTWPGTAAVSFEPGHAIGQQPYWTYACTEAVCSAAGRGTLDVRNRPPFNTGSIRHTPDPVREGQRITFTVPFLDHTDLARAVICKTDELRGSSCAPGQAWVDSGPFGRSPATARLDMPMETRAGPATYYAFACDADGGCSPSRRGTFTVLDPATPTAATASPDPADPGDTVTFTVDWDRSTEANKAVVCRTNAITQGAATCPGGLLASGALSNASPSTARYAPEAAEAGTLDYYAFTCTAAGGCSQASVAGSLQVNDRADPSVAEMKPAAQVVNVAGTAHVSAHVEKVTGGPLRGRPVTFTSTGANPSTGRASTSLSGDASYAYAGRNIGVDVVRVQVDDVPGATSAAVVTWRPTSNAAIATEVVFDQSESATATTAATRGAPVTVAFRALNGDGTSFAGTVRYGVGPFGVPPAKVLTTTVDPSDAGEGTITFTPTTTGVWQVFAFADRPAPDGVFGAQDPSELDGASAIVAREPCGTSTAVAAYGPGTKQRSETATVGALVVDNCGQPQPGVSVTFARTGANPGTATATTGAEGLAEHTWTGAVSGVDVVDVRVGGVVAPGAALVVWTDPPPSASAYAVTLDPPSQQQEVGAPVRLVATVVDQGGEPVAGVTVRFARSGTNGDAGESAVTGDDGAAAFEYVGTSAGVDGVTAEVVDAVTVDGEPASSSVAAASVVWTPEPPAVATYVVSMSDPQTVPVGSDVEVVASVSLPTGEAVGGVTVRFARHGVNGAASDDVVTSPGGVATYSYRGASGGVDVVTAQAVAAPGGAGAGSVGGGAGATAVTWVPPAPSPPGSSPVSAGARGHGRGYWLVDADGGVFTLGDASFLGSTGDRVLNAPIVGMAASPSGDGYWFVASDGGVFSFGDAGFYGSTGALRLNQPIVGMASSPSGRGYWLVARDGGVFAFGDAVFWGSTGALRLNQPIVGMASSPSGRGYWLVARDGGVFSFGDAAFHGSAGALRLNEPIVGMAATATGRGYWFVASDGGLFSFGDARYYGSAAAAIAGSAAARAVGLAASATGNGYVIAAADGSTWSFGDAAAGGSTPPPARPVVGVARAG